MKVCCRRSRFGQLDICTSADLIIYISQFHRASQYPSFGEGPATSKLYSVQPSGPEFNLGVLDFDVFSPGPLYAKDFTMAK